MVNERVDLLGFRMPRFTSSVRASLARRLPALILLLLGNCAWAAAPATAQWIWQAEDGPANAWVAFRKTVRLDEVPTTAVATLSADTKYWLWVNGRLVVSEGGAGRGPSQARPWVRQPEIWTLPPEVKPTNSWSEEVDLSGVLRAGENTVAVLVWYWGRETHKGMHIDSGRGGLWFHAELGRTTVESDASWKVRQHPAYALDSGDSGNSIVAYPVKYDARLALDDWTPQAWQQPGYDDTAWPTATAKGAPPVAPWYNLVPREVPRLVDHGLLDYPSHPATSFPFVSDGTEIKCVLPWNRQITPYLEVEAEAGQEIFVTTDNRLNKMTAHYTTRAGRQAFEGYSWMNGHTIIYRIPAGVKVLGLRYRWQTVGHMVGSFTCDDPFFQRIWDMGRNTLEVCARDNFMDCPDRERACWIGDVADQASYLFYCMDDAGRQLLKKAIRITMAYSHEGVYGALGPLRLRELPTQSLQFVDQGIWQYYLNTGDLETLRYAYPYVRDYLRLWYVGPDGLPVRKKRSMDSWAWSDWGEKGTIDDTVVLDALYFMALKSAKKMALTLRETKDIAWYDQRIQATGKGCNNKYWKGAFYSSNPKKFQDDRANSLAILAGLAGKEKQKSIVEKVLIPNQFCSPHFEWMVEEALCEAGRHDAALKRMKERNSSQVDRKGMSTLYEMFPNGGTYNHAWNAPNTVLSKHIAGIAPTKPGWSEYQILPNLGHFTSVKQVVPSVRGDITVDIKLTNATYNMDLVPPKGTTAMVGIPKASISPKTIKANGSTIWENGSFIAKIPGITWNGEDGKFVKFNVAPGAWNFSATEE